jgi:hypothetical protein
MWIIKISSPYALLTLDEAIRFKKASLIDIVTSEEVYSLHERGVARQELQNLKSVEKAVADAKLENELLRTMK